MEGLGFSLNSQHNGEEFKGVGSVYPFFFLSFFFFFFCLFFLFFFFFFFFLPLFFSLFFFFLFFLLLLFIYFCVMERCFVEGLVLLFNTAQ